MNDRISYEEKKELPDSVFGLPERREYPMPDAAHVRAAEAYFRYCPEDLKPKLARAILDRAGIRCQCGKSRDSFLRRTIIRRLRKLFNIPPVGFYPAGGFCVGRLTEKS